MGYGGGLEEGGGGVDYQTHCSNVYAVLDFWRIFSSCLVDDAVVELLGAVVLATKPVVHHVGLVESRCWYWGPRDAISFRAIFLLTELYMGIEAFYLLLP